MRHGSMQMIVRVLLNGFQLAIEPVFGAAGALGDAALKLDRGMANVILMQQNML
jgi:hypothetical protein